MGRRCYVAALVRPKAVVSRAGHGPSGVPSVLSGVAAFVDVVACSPVGANGVAAACPFGLMSFTDVQWSGVAVVPLIGSTCCSAILTSDNVAELAPQSVYCTVALADGLVAVLT